MIIRKNTKKPILLILASQSLGRKKILTEMGIDFIVDPANIDEESYIISDPIELVKVLSLEKAKSIALKHANSLILAADTIVLKDNEIIGKPKDKKHAKEMLLKLSGTTHEVYTGITLSDSSANINIVKVGHATVEFNQLSEAEIDAYLTSNEWLGKAGSYSSQENGGKILIKKIDGEQSNVVGLPKTIFLAMLSELNLEIIIIDSPNE